jgi:LysM repeat protein
MNHTTRRTGYTSLSATLLAVGLSLTLCGCKSWFQPKPGLLSTRNGMVPPPYETPSEEPTMGMGAAPSPEPFPSTPMVMEEPSPVPAIEEDATPPAAEEGPKLVELPAAPKSEQLTHTVAKNESLWVIARKYGITYQELASANSLDPKAVLRPGKVLVIPPGGRPGATGEGHAPTVKAGEDPGLTSLPASSGKTTTYTVQRGDCLSKIAARAKMKTAELRALNGLKSDTIYIGQKLKIRGKISGSAPAPAAPEAPKPIPPAMGATAAEALPDEVKQPPAAAAGTGARADIPTIPADETNPATGPATDTGATKPETAPATGAERVELTPKVPAAAPADNLRKLPHDVCKDDTLEDIAEMYGTTVQAIRQANPNLKTDQDLKVGMTIMVPYK